MSALIDWGELVENVNGRTHLGQRGVRDPDAPCEDFTATSYDGTGRCRSDGHYLCVDCDHLSPVAPRFEEYGAEGRKDRLRLFWRRGSASPNESDPGACRCTWGEMGEIAAVAPGCPSHDRSVQR